MPIELRWIARQRTLRSARSDPIMLKKWNNAVRSVWLASLICTLRSVGGTAEVRSRIAHPDGPQCEESDLLSD